MSKLQKNTKVRLAVLGIFIVAVLLLCFDASQVYDRPVTWLNSKLGTAFPMFPQKAFSLGLDLQGGTSLVYEADTSKVATGQESSSMDGVRDVIERRVNAFGVSEPVVQINQAQGKWRLIVELAGVQDVKEAIKMIGETPLLEFKEQNPNTTQRALTPAETTEMNSFNKASRTKANTALKEALAGKDFTEIVKSYTDIAASKETGGDLGWINNSTAEYSNLYVAAGKTEVGKVYSRLIEQPNALIVLKVNDKRDSDTTGKTPNMEYKVAIAVMQLKQAADILPSIDPWKSTGLTGQQLKTASVELDPQTQEPMVSLVFNDEGAKLFGEITTRNVNKPVAIFLDGQPISVPNVNEPIRDGKAVISGNFDLTSAKLLAQRLNAGALPVAIKLVSQQTVGASLGQDSLQKSLFAGLIGFALVALFMIIFYRLPGLLAVIALTIYTIIVLAIFKLIPVTMTLAGIAGFILTIGMAVDANILIFSRTKEEVRWGKPLQTAVEEGFRRAWPSIRDSNICSLITSLILLWFSSSMIKGFAFTLAIGVLVSMFSAITVSRFLIQLVAPWVKNPWWFGISVKSVTSNVAPVTGKKS